MSSRAAVDTNILVKLYSAANEQERLVAEGLVLARPVISQQVVSEYLNVTQRLQKIPKQEVMERCNRVFKQCEIVQVTHGVIDLAAHLLARYDFQLFDSIVVAAALEADCATLYSADFQHNQLIEKRLRIINPFL